MARTLARQAAMQLLYERLSGGEADDESLDLVYEQLAMSRGEKSFSPNVEDREYISDVLAGVEQFSGELDSSVTEHSTGDIPLSRVAHVDLCILRLAAYEMLHRTDVPDSVAINEAVEMANIYSEPRSSRYINGVLGAIHRDKREG